MTCCVSSMTLNTVYSGQWCLLLALNAVRCCWRVKNCLTRLVAVRAQYRQSVVVTRCMRSWNTCVLVTSRLVERWRRPVMTRTFDIDHTHLVCSSFFSTVNRHLFADNKCWFFFSYDSCTNHFWNVLIHLYISQSSASWYQRDCSFLMPNMLVKFRWVTLNGISKCWWVGKIAFFEQSGLLPLRCYTDENFCPSATLICSVMNSVQSSKFCL